MSKKGARSDEIDVFAPRIEPINGAATPNSPLISAPGKDSNLSEYQRLYGAVAHGGEEIRVPNGESLYTALDRRGLLEHASAPSNIGMNLVQEGEIGLAMFNGRPRFLAPGRHTLWSPLSSVLDIVPITQKLIALGPIQIVTVNQGELGLSRRNGETVLLDPGRYVLKAPHVFEKCTAANAQYIELGTYRRITVPAGFVAIAFDKGKQIVIRPEDTRDGFETNSPTFLFDPKTGFQPVQLQVRELDELKVNTRDGITITCKGLITYLINDPRIAFMAVQDVHGAVKRGAEATLTSLFLNASIDEIAPSIPTHPLEAKVANPDDKGKGKKLPELIEPMNAERADFSRHVRESFLHDFSEKVHTWGIELKDLNIEKLEFDQNVKDLLRKRAQARLETATNLANMYQQTEVAMQQADRQRREVQIKAEAEATATRLKADADFYAAERRAAAAKLLFDVPLAAQLELKRLDVEMVRATGDKTTFMPMNLAIGDVALSGAAGQMFFAKQRTATVPPAGVVQGN